MVEILKFEIKNSLKKKKMFQIHEKIDPLYIELAEYTLITLYKIYPFSSAFEGIPSGDPNEQFKSCVVTWADVFMLHGMSCKNKLKNAIKIIISLGRLYPPALPEVIVAYKGNIDALRNVELLQYALYIDSKFEYIDNNVENGQVLKDILPFDLWREETNAEVDLDL